MTRPNISEIKARCEGATEGPWVRNPDYKFVVLYEDDGIICTTNGYRDTDFIAHSRTDIPALIKYVEHLERINKLLHNIIEATPCDPDITTEQDVAWEEYRKALNERD